MDFSGITEVKIPQGNVEKITETSGGRVLWEKERVKLNTPRWVVCGSNIAYSNTNSRPVVSLTRVAKTDSFATVVRLSEGDELLYGPSIVLKGSDSKTGLATSASIWAFGDGAMTSKGIRLIGMSKPILGNTVMTTNASWSGGMMLLNKGSSTKFATQYALMSVEHRICDKPDTYGYVKVSTAPSSDTSVFITGSPERNEYLITGLSGRLAVVKQHPSTDTLTYYSSSLGRTCWASGIGSSGLYFGATGTNNKISYSANGTSWTTYTVFSNASNYVLGVEYLSAKKQVCAISSNSGKIAVSSDGKTWQEKDAPFSSALAYAYSPECNALCVVDSRKAYITQNGTKWIEAAIPGGAVNFRDLVHITQGVFAGYKYLDTKIYFLSVYPALGATNGYVLYTS